MIVPAFRIVFFLSVATIAIAYIPKNFVILGGNACGKVVVDFAEIGEELVMLIYQK